MSEYKLCYDFPILNILDEESILGLEIKGKYLEISGGDGGFDVVTFNANELRMLAHEFKKIAKIIDGTE